MLLIDADTPAYAAAAVCEELDAVNAIWEANKSIERLLVATNSTHFKLYLTGDTNFRYEVFPEYKAHRLNTPRPRFLPQVREAVLREWNGVLSEGCEADDLLGIEQTTNYLYDIESVICTIDKDLDQIAGWHYHPGIKRKGEWVREPSRYVVSPLEALRFFYYQMLVGDNADGIKGVVGIGPAKATKMLKDIHQEEDLFNVVRDAYSNDAEMEMNARCLWIFHKENDDIISYWKEKDFYVPDY